HFSLTFNPLLYSFFPQFLSSVFSVHFCMSCYLYLSTSPPSLFPSIHLPISLSLCLFCSLILSLSPPPLYPSLSPSLSPFPPFSLCSSAVDSIRLSLLHRGVYHHLLSGDARGLQPHLSI